MPAEDHKKKKRTRSPAYPAFGLEDCISKARALFDAEDRHPMPVEIAAGHWGYKASSSGAAQAISSLKQFGLLVEDGKSGGRQVRLSPEALAILLDEENSSARQAAIKTAALAPKIHRELWEKYDGRLGSDSAIRIYLTLNREHGVYNKDAADDLIKQFRETIEFAKLSTSDKIDDEDREDEQPVAQKGKSNGLFDSYIAETFFGGPRVAKATSPPQANSAKTMRDLAIPLMDNEVAYLRVPSPLSEENYEYLVGQIAMFKLGIVARPSTGTTPASPMSPAADEDGPKTAQIPMMITKQMRLRLNSLGIDDEKIAAMTPADAWNALNAATEMR